jgi:prepilin-type N-terminal cleavage/methylation domain-containing protein
MKQRGFTLIELMIAVVIGITFIMFVAGVVNGTSGGANPISWGINGLTESRCIEGYKFIVGQEGQARQILDEFGKGVRCEKPNASKPGGFGSM